MKIILAYCSYGCFAVWGRGRVRCGEAFSFLFFGISFRDSRLFCSDGLLVRRGGIVFLFV